MREASAICGSWIGQSTSHRDAGAAATPNEVSRRSTRALRRSTKPTVRRRPSGERRRDAAPKGRGPRRPSREPPKRAPSGDRERRPESIVRVPVVRGRPLDGRWLWTTRPFAEQDLVDELAIALGRGSASIAGPSIVTSRGAPTAPEGALDLTFARQGFRVSGEARSGDALSLADRCASMLASVVPENEPFGLSVWVPDSEQTNPLADGAAALEARIAGILASRAPPRVPAPLAALARSGGVLLQVALVARDHALAGAVSAEHALTLAPGGRARMRVAGERPSRAARKLEEALAWLDLSPGPGDVCVDLGAAPGGWSWALLERRARVIAVDPAELRPDIARHRLLTHHKASAFQFAPDEPVDWLFCDMAWRPLEVAQLLAKWGRRKWARFLVANLKLPMKKKAETVEDLRAVIAGGGWQRIRARQLYHDRDEITLTAHL